jgi:hypothetical protein
VTNEEAMQALADAEVVPCAFAGVTEAKEILEACLEADIPAVLEREEACGKPGGGCAPRLVVCAKPEDVPRVLAMMHERWQALIEREGTLVDYARDPDGASRAIADPAAGEAEAEEPPCPACGTAAPLVDGACTGCGLQLG